MKNYITFSLIFLLAKGAEGQPKEVSAEQWQSDLRFLQQTVHKEYPFLLKKVTAAQFDSAANKLYNDIPRLQPHEILAGFARQVALFKYGHTDISWREGPVKYHIVPANLYWFSEGIYVEGTDSAYADMLGAQLVAVEGVPVEKALEKLRPLLPAENEQYFKAYIADYLLIPEALHAQGITSTLKQQLKLTLKKNGKQWEQSFAAVDAFRFPRRYGFTPVGGKWMTVRQPDATPNYLKNLDRIYYYEYLPEYKTLYVRHSQIQDDPKENIPAFYEKVFDFIEKNDVQKLVLDVRLNGGGNNYKNKPIVTGIIKSKINQPGKFYVIIGRRTFSACQNLVNELSNYTNAIFVGEPTSENINFYGDNRRIELPNSKLPAMLSFAWWQDKPQWENDEWLAPTLAVDLSFKDYVANHDPVLASTLQLKPNDVVADPMAVLRQLYAAKQTDSLKAAAWRMSKDPRYRYVNFEDKINRAGYELLNAKQYDGAMFVFELNTQLYPNSANAWDSYAEACWKAGKKDMAKIYFNKAIALDPDGATADNARRMLKQMESE